MIPNTGRAFWKPYESDFGRQLRIIVANPILSRTKSGRKQLQNITYNDCYPLPGHRIDEDMIRKYRSATDTSWPLFRPAYKKTSTRFCPRCCELGYHSWLFAMEWQTQCPVHEIPLESFINSEDITHALSRYHTGALTYTAKAALGDALLNPERYFRALEPLESFCQLDNAVIPISLFNILPQNLSAILNSSPVIDPLNVHHDHYANEEIFASLILKLFPKSWSLIRKVKPIQQKYIKIKFNRDPVRNTYLFELDKLEPYCQPIRKRVERRIINLLKWPKGKALTERALDKVPVIDFFYKEMDILLVAYQIWRSLMGIPINTHRSERYFCGKRLYSNIFGHIAPLIPVPMNCFIEGKHYPFPLAPGDINHRNALPLGLSLLIFEIDCWCLFRSILKFLTTASAVLDSAPNGRIYTPSLVDKIPLWARPGSHYSNNVAVYLIEDHFVTLIPMSYLDVACRDIDFEKSEDK